MKIAVTGGRGFLGRHVAKLAEAQGHQVWAFDTSDGNDILGDLQSLSGADAVIHAAGKLGTAELFDEPEEAIRINVVGTLRVMRWCLDNDASFVGITMPKVFPSVYTATKVCARHLGWAYHESYGLKTSWVQAFNVYGPNQRCGPGHPQKIVPTFATLAWQGKPLPVWGGGLQTVDLVHSDDVARMCVDATRFVCDEEFDAGTGVSWTVLQVARFVNEVTGNKAGIEHLPMRPGEVACHISATGQGWDLVGWHPEHNWDRVAEVVRRYKP